MSILVDRLYYFIPPKSEQEIEDLRFDVKIDSKITSVSLLSNHFYQIRLDVSRGIWWTLNGIILTDMILFSNIGFETEYRFHPKNSEIGLKYGDVYRGAADIMEKHGYFRLTEEFVELGSEYNLI